MAPTKSPRSSKTSGDTGFRTAYFCTRNVAPLAVESALIAVLAQQADLAAQAVLASQVLSVFLASSACAATANAASMEQRISFFIIYATVFGLLLRTIRRWNRTFVQSRPRPDHFFFSPFFFPPLLPFLAFLAFLPGFALAWVAALDLTEAGSAPWTPEAKTNATSVRSQAIFLIHCLIQGFGRICKQTKKRTLVATGHGEGVVWATGDQTEIGHIARLITEAANLSTPLTRKIAHFSKLLLSVILDLEAGTFAIGVARYEKPVEMFMAAVALAVGAIAEGLSPGSLEHAMNKLLPPARAMSRGRVDQARAQPGLTSASSDDAGDPLDSFRSARMPIIAALSVQRRGSVRRSFKPSL